MERDVWRSRPRIIKGRQSPSICDMCGEPLVRLSSGAERSSGRAGEQESGLAGQAIGKDTKTSC